MTNTNVKIMRAALRSGALLCLTCERQKRNVPALSYAFEINHPIWCQPATQSLPEHITHEDIDNWGDGIEPSRQGPHEVGEAHNIARPLHVVAPADHDEQ